MRARGARPRGSRGGYTLVELLVAVAMISVLAVLAIVSYRQWLRWSRTADGKELVLAIASGQQAYFEETEGYLSCSSSPTDYYPMAPTGGKHLFHDSAHADHPCWSLLQTDADAPTYQSFVTLAGEPGTSFPALPTDMQLTVAPPANRPWFIVMGVSDTDADGVQGYMVTSSLQPSEVHMENPEE